MKELEETQQEKLTNLTASCIPILETRVCVSLTHLELIYKKPKPQKKANC